MFRSRLHWTRPAVLSLLLLFVPALVRAESVIVLQNDFIEHYKRKVTIDTQFTVDKAHKKPNPPSKDGDLHVAGRADEVKLPIVAEIMNARDDRAAVKTIHDAEDSGEKVAMSGAWRLWCEHGGNSEQIQGVPLKRFKSTNPDHVFEIHPVTRLGGRSLLDTLKPIKGYRTKDAHDAFTRYEAIGCRIIPGADTTTLVTNMAGYNYVEFIMEINSEPLEVEDGLLVMCKVRDLEGELLVRNRRMVMVKDSTVERRTREKPVGTRLHVLGLPRINLSLVSWRVKAAAEGQREVLTWSLPYEIIVVGFYNYVDDHEDDETPMAKNLDGRDGRFVPQTLSPKEVEKRRVVPAPPALPIELGQPKATKSASSSATKEALWHDIGESVPLVTVTECPAPLMWVDGPANLRSPLGRSRFRRR
jgi:hypothetical protein